MSTVADVLTPPPEELSGQDSEHPLDKCWCCPTGMMEISVPRVGRALSSHSLSCCCLGGRVMHSSLGKNPIKTRLTQGAIRWVDGERKLTLSTMIVTRTDSVTSIIVNRRYLPRRGTVSDVGGIISARSKKNTVRERRMETQRDIFSPESAGR